MDHDSALPRVPDLVNDHLDADEAESVRSHVATCTECQAIQATYQEVLATLARQPAVLPIHPSPEAIVALATAGNEMSSGVSRRIQTHIEACAACARDLATVHGFIEPSDQPPFWSRFRFRFRSPVALAAPALAVLALALAYPAYRGLVELPRARNQISRVGWKSTALHDSEQPLNQTLTQAQQDLQRTRGWGGGAAVLVLDQQLRGGSPVNARISLAPDQPVMPLFVNLPAARQAASAGDSLLVSIRHATGNDVVWQYVGAAQTMWSAGAGGLFLLVPAAALLPGEYRLQIAKVGSKGAEFTASFQIAPGH